MDAFSKYERQIGLDDFGVKGQMNLAAARILVVGAGGVGSAAIPLLAASGIGEIVVADGDVVAAPNLHRQTLYSVSDIGRKKGDIAVRRILDLNPDCRAESFTQKIVSSGQLKCLLYGMDICLDASNSFRTRFMISDACRQTGIPCIMAAAEGYVSQMFCFGDGFYLDDAVSDASARAEDSRALPIFPAAAHIGGVCAAGAAIAYSAKVFPYETGLFRSFDFVRARFFECNLIKKRDIVF